MIYRFFYKVIRPFFLGGLPHQVLLDILNSTEEDLVLDLGCGDGFLAELIKYKEYCGLDLDLKSINKACKRNLTKAYFFENDVRNLFFNHFKANKVVLYGLLHHLNDADVKKLLERLVLAKPKMIVTLDPVFSRNILSDIICRYDRGRFVRTEIEMIRLIKSSGLNIIKKIRHSCRTKIANYISFELGVK